MFGSGKKNGGSRFDASATQYLVEAVQDALKRGTAAPMNDPILHTYHGQRIDWQHVWTVATQGDDTVPKFGNGAYWFSEGQGLEPISMVAFIGSHFRWLIASLPDTDPALLQIMAGDGFGVHGDEPGDGDYLVMSAAKQNLAERGSR